MQQTKVIRSGLSKRLGSSYSIIKTSRVRSWAAVGLSLALAALVVWVYQILASPNHNRAAITSSPSVSDGNSINSTINTQPSAAAGGSGGSTVSVQKNGNGPASVTINGQPVDLQNGSSVHQSSGGTNVDVNVQNGTSTNSNSQNTNVFSSSNSSTFSSSQVNSYSYTSGGSN